MSRTLSLTRRMRLQSVSIRYANSVLINSHVQCSKTPETCNKITETFHCFSFCIYFNFKTGSWINILFLNGWSIANCELRITLFVMRKSTKKRKKKRINLDGMKIEISFITVAVCIDIGFLEKCKISLPFFQRSQFHSIFPTIHWCWLNNSTATQLKLKKNSNLNRRNFVWTPPHYVIFNLLLSSTLYCAHGAPFAVWIYLFNAQVLVSSTLISTLN